MSQVLRIPEPPIKAAKEIDPQLRLMAALERLYLAVEHREQEYRSHRYELEYFRAPHVWLIAFFASLVVGFIGGFIGAVLRVWIT
jgi:hypothetical protein